VNYQTEKSKDYGVNLCEGCLEKQREVDRLKEEVQRLKQELRRGKRKQEQGFFGSSTSSAQVPVKAKALAENQAKKGGAKVGHPGHGRQVCQREEADEIRVAKVVEEKCQECQCQLQGQSSNGRVLYDLQREEVKKVYYEIERKRCPKCRKIVAGKVAEAMPHAKLTNELVVEVAEQHYVLGRTLGQLSERFAINYSTLAEALKRVGNLLEPCLEKLKAEYRQAAVRHADETGWRTDGGNGYSWYFGSSAVSLYLFRTTRSNKVPLEVLGKERLSGVLVVDRYAGYNQVPCEIQYCYAHLLREMKDLAAEFESSLEVKNYTQAMQLCLTDAMQLRQRNLSEADYRAAAEKIKAEILRHSAQPATHLGVQKWQNFFVEKAPRLYQWCESPEIPAENNYAEREIRKVVIARKLSYGSQSTAGAKTREIWTSVLQSLRKRVPHPRAHLLTTLHQLNHDSSFDLASQLFAPLSP
jgi:transposase